jgi:tetratricopeptide (TPR) repeat protein
MIAAYSGRTEEAADYYRYALDAYRDDRNQHGEASALSNLSRAQIALGDIPGAIASAGQALVLYRELQAGFRLGNGLYAFSIALSAANRYDEAFGALSEALLVFREVRQQFWEGMALFRMSEVQLAAGNHRQAATLAEQSLVVLRQSAGTWRQANAVLVLGKALNALGQVDRARACWHDALTEFTALGSPEADEARRLLHDPSAPDVAV